MKKWLHNLLKGMSLTAALFVFQACYGTPAGYPDAWEEAVGPATEAVAEDLLKKEDDAAYAALGGKFRMPTQGGDRGASGYQE